jgi:hypothetical protein
MNDDMDVKRLIKSLGNGVQPEKGFKEQLLADLMKEPDLNDEIPEAGKFIFEKPLRLIFSFSLILSIVIRAAIGSQLDLIIYKMFAGGF